MLSKLFDHLLEVLIFLFIAALLIGCFWPTINDAYHQVRATFAG
jgi:hypothetical protein